VCSDALIDNATRVVLIVDGTIQADAFAEEKIGFDHFHLFALTVLAVAASVVLLGFLRGTGDTFFGWIRRVGKVVAS